MSKKKDNQNIKKINCTQTVFSILKQLDTDNEKFIFCFRGHKLSTYELKASLKRSQNEGIRNNYRETITEIVRNFPDEFSSIDSFKFSDIAKLQHNGIPTDLLDVTFNPLVALFFATEQAKGEKGIQRGEFIIFKIPKNALYYANDTRFIFENSDNTENQTSIENGLLNVNLSFPRIKEQDGAFLYSKNDIPNEWIYKTFEIENRSKINLRQELAAINITQSRLFPELSEYYRSLQKD